MPPTVPILQKNSRGSTPAPWPGALPLDPTGGCASDPCFQGARSTSPCLGLYPGRLFFGAMPPTTNVKNPELGWWNQPKFFSLTEIFVKIVLNVLQICLAWLYLYLHKTINVSLGIFRFMNYVQLDSVLNYNLLGITIYYRYNYWLYRLN